MSTDYANSSFEQKARELLSPLSAACPDTVWESLTADLAARRAEADNKWFKAANTPKTALIAASVIAVITLSSWLFFTNKGNKHNAEVVNTNVQPPAPQKANVALVNENKPATPVAVVVKKDSVIPQAPVPVQSQPLVQNNGVQAPVLSAGMIKNKPVAKEQPSADNSSSPIIVRKDVFDASTSPDAPPDKGGLSDLNDDTAKTVHRGISSAQTETAVSDSIQNQ